MMTELKQYADMVLSSLNGPDPLQRAATLYPDNIAIISNDKQLTFKELNISVNNLVSILPQTLENSLGSQNEPILIKATPTTEYLILLLALFRSGRMFIPYSPRISQEELEKLAHDLNACIYPQDLSAIGLPDSNTLENGLCCYTNPTNIMLSSGSTGTPKKIVHNIRAHILSAIGAEAGMSLSCKDRYLLSLPLNHVGGQAIVFRCLLSGAAMVLPQSSSTSNLVIEIQQKEVTVMSLVPTQLIRLIEDPSLPLPQSQVRAIILGGAPISQDLIKKVLLQCPHLKLFATYGMTETAAQVCTAQVTATGITAGNPLPYHELREINGEIQIKGPTISCGLLNNGRITPVTEQDGWLHTGDLGVLTAEGLSITGRKDNMFISGGENICPETIEKLMLQIPYIKACVIVPVPHPIWGQAICAIIDTDGNIDDIKKELRKKTSSIYIPKYFLPWPSNIEPGLKIKRKAFISYARNAITI